jgi:site-specific DNA-methyltransferase (adenine-specific)
MKQPRSLATYTAPENQYILGSSFDEKNGLPSLPARSVDHIICDPPYEESVHAGGVSVRSESEQFGRSRKGDPFKNRCAEQGWRTELSFAHMGDDERWKVAAMMTRVCRGWILVFCSIDGVSKWQQALTDAGARKRTTCIWIKEDATPRFTGDAPAFGFECIVLAWNGHGRSVWNGHGKVGIYKGTRRPSTTRRHPTEKPDYLMEALVTDFTRPGELICDPYSGGGSTLIAAKRLGRKYLGWEMNPAYHKLGTDALRRTKEQFRFFERAHPRTIAESQLDIFVEK